MATSDLAATVETLYTNATAESTRLSCMVGQNYFQKFTNSILGFSFRPNLRAGLTLKGLLLCFFAGSLFENAKKFQSATIRNYVGHVRSSWSKQGSALSDFDAAVLSRILRGVSNLRPTNPDNRVAFLLPHYTFPTAFISPQSTDVLLFKAAVVFGFLGMFRYSSFGKLTAPSIVLVTVSGRELPLRSGKYSELSTYTSQYDISGFYFRLRTKFHTFARAYYCTLSDLPLPWSIFCPVQILVELGRHQLLCRGQIFPPKTLSARALGLYMNYVANSSASFSPHSLRIGGHTFYSVHNMHEDFVHYLGRRKINRASQLYYRARATDNILRLSQFFKRASDTSSLAGGGLYEK